MMVGAICHKCNKKYAEFWVDRDHKGFPTFEGLVCGECGSKNCIRRDWADNNTAVHPDLDGNGEINRFEYSFRDKEGKLHNKKMDAEQVKKHYANNYKEQRK